jgi:hypothetical protein
MPPTSEVIVRDSLLIASYPEPLRVTGPLLSLVLRTEDVWQRYNHFRSVRGSQSGFPLLTPIMETYDGPAWRLIAISWSAPFQGFARCSGIQVFRLYSSHPYNAGRAGLGCGRGVGGSEAMCTLHAGVMLCIVFVTMLPDMVDDSFTSTICLYLSPSQLCLIKRVSNFKVSQLNVGYSYSTFS